MQGCVSATVPAGYTVSKQNTACSHALGPSYCRLQEHARLKLQRENGASFGPKSHPPLRPRFPHNTRLLKNPAKESTGHWTQLVPLVGRQGMNVAIDIDFDSD